MNTSVVIRESLLPKAFEMAEKVVNDRLQFKVSTGIVAGTNPFISGSPYADLIYPGLSTGGRIAMEIKNAAKDGHLKDLMT